MEIKILASVEAVAREGAAIIAAAARVAVAGRGRFVPAVSGGQTPWLMLRDLAGEDALVTRSDKVGMLMRLRDGDRSIPAGRMGQDNTLVIADRAAAGQLEAN
jgi:hypothetical protein